MDSGQLEKLRHSCAHLLAAAVMELCPKLKEPLVLPLKNGFFILILTLEI